MSDAHDRTQVNHFSRGQRIRELAVFLLLAFAIWPIISVAFVGGYGFLIWIYQIFAGPPGPPSVGH
ncbi:periplasmic nitrate reductase, NapE protein [Paracoccus sp. MBLB3053]|uniref:Periplasmic nitrate reductase, NapE protein n=1 Tax=Paracoccus aurantius TaxID=3073814 RepID=A0ABU2HT76_9RHOB|nr:periplasmic nitrate reductase, NapE protein [Paracoccus sp. MBLB3053]MDS9468252.1 periplasmic nitrate reductase, NapE protein [Paracoccus sp. MBLB3053]